MRRHKMSELPETDDGIAQWCQDLFITKVHKQYFTHQTFLFTLKLMPLHCLLLKSGCSTWEILHKRRFQRLGSSPN